jgi:hypothetical protein
MQKANKRGQVRHDADDGKIPFGRNSYCAAVIWALQHDHAVDRQSYVVQAAAFEHSQAVT